MTEGMEVLKKAGFEAENCAVFADKMAGLLDDGRNLFGEGKKCGYAICGRFGRIIRRFYWNNARGYGGIGFRFAVLLPYLGVDTTRFQSGLVISMLLDVSEEPVVAVLGEQHVPARRHGRRPVDARRPC